MIRITKSSCPKLLLKYARDEPLDIDEPFRDPKVKEIIKNSLLAEQRYICAYCMTSITFEKMVIEHIEPKSKCRELARTYSNLLATCNNSDNHCDKSKKDKKLLIANPLTLFDENENAINYLRDGSIELESGTSLYKDISVTLNLNTAKYLTRNRKTVIEETKRAINSMIKKRYSKKKIQNNIKKVLKKEKEAKHATPYSGVMRFEFNKHI